MRKKTACHKYGILWIVEHNFPLCKRTQNYNVTLYVNTKHMINNFIRIIIERDLIESISVTHLKWILNFTDAHSTHTQGEMFFYLWNVRNALFSRPFPFFTLFFKWIVAIMHVLLKEMSSCFKTFSYLQWSSSDLQHLFDWTNPIRRKNSNSIGRINFNAINIVLLWLLNVWTT